MNQKKFGKIFQGLLSSGVSINDATKTAAKLASKVEKTTPEIGSSKPGPKPTGNSLSDRIMAFATKQRGAVWNLQGLARALNAKDTNYISTTLTSLTKSGKIVRVGRGEYRKAH